jgi:hypothetical protein
MEKHKTRKQKTDDRGLWAESLSAQNPVRFDVVALIPPMKIVHLDKAWEARS